MLKVFIDRKIYLLLAIIIIGACIAYYFNYQLNEYDIAKRNDSLSSIHKGVEDKFTESLNRFAYLMSGLRSYLRYADTLPDEYEMQRFIRYQAEELNLNDSLIVSFLNKEHEFIYSFTLDEIDPTSLVGTSVKDFRDNVEINRLNNLMMTDQMRLFPPINLIEGWVGIPLNFPVIRKGEVIGYIAALLNFRNIVQPIYELQDSDVFAFYFSVDGGSTFDREQVHNGSPVYHNRQDDKYFAQYDLRKDQFLYSTVSIYGVTFKLGTAYINENRPNPYIRWLFLLVYGLIVCFSAYALYRYQQYQKLNTRLKSINETIKNQNSELEELNATKIRLMSIIGHDLKGPISSIVNLIGLVQDDAITLKDTKKVLKQLNPVTKNTLNLLENLLQWAMVNNDNSLYKPQIIDIDKIVDENFILLQSQANQKRITFHKSIDKDLEAFADHNMIATVIRNLLSNALKYSKPDSEVQVIGQEQQNEIVLKVIDKGIGISENEIHKILASEIKASKQGTAGEKGTGLGLELCKSFLEKNNGCLHISSKVGVGSTFQITLPRHG